MATLNLGNIKFNWAYVGGTAYVVDDVSIQAVHIFVN